MKMTRWRMASQDPLSKALRTAVHALSISCTAQQEVDMPEPPTNQHAVSVAPRARKRRRNGQSRTHPYKRHPVSVSMFEVLGVACVVIPVSGTRRTLQRQRTEEDSNVPPDCAPRRHRNAATNLIIVCRSSDSAPNSWFAGQETLQKGLTVVSDHWLRHFLSLFDTVKAEHVVLHSAIDLDSRWVPMPTMAEYVNATTVNRKTSTVGRSSSPTACLGTSDVPMLVVRYQLLCLLA
ncbi:hypothetical protein P171DRAFT_232593 [Karstenula rhodostoma CBS 690.94]|uniref:Uncharacterized protein n=1 Tax=Karstenula rhodostoma CBS 690.94 TaxID=1392251 RepID=A0A9P4PR36_9PLEO|nr:hypothetical protein P171DRAFT_232593 [Karstenula rhodostoma CBS 690.94]